MALYLVQRIQNYIQSRSYLRFHQVLSQNIKNIPLKIQKKKLSVRNVKQSEDLIVKRVIQQDKLFVKNVRVLEIMFVVDVEAKVPIYVKGVEEKVQNDVYYALERDM